MPTPSKIVVIVGPTAVGKSDTAMALAETFRGELVNADAAAFYRGLDIGSAKPGPEARRAVPHHLLDIANPDEVITTADFQSRAYGVIDDILTRGRLPIVVGGSGLYVRTIVEGFVFPPHDESGECRRRLEGRSHVEGAAALYAELQRIDPAIARKVDPRNVRRVIRALEVFEISGQPMSRFHGIKLARYESCIVGLTRPRAELYQRIELRVESMLRGGLVDEVRGLVSRWDPAACPALTAIGYKELIPYVLGQGDLGEAAAHIVRATKKLSRSQEGSWFKRTDPGIVWFEVGGIDALAGIRDAVSLFLQEPPAAVPAS